MKRIATAAALIALLLASQARAEPGSIVNWLMNEPLTLWDWGMVESNKRAGEIGDELEESMGGRISSYAFYEWDENEFVFKLSFWQYMEAITHENCNTIRRRFIMSLAGYYDFEIIDVDDGVWVWDETALREWQPSDDEIEKFEAYLHYKINRWFSHQEFQRTGRDEDLEEKLSRIMYVEVSLHPPDFSSEAIVCKDRIYEFEAPSKPYVYEPLLAE
jgi:hypothetical protein